jgi:LPS sulfotransferase NodH
MDSIVKKGMTRNRVFGAKLHWYQFEFIPQLFTSHRDNYMQTALFLAKSFPRLQYVWLIRHDKIRQAISYYRASKTGEWWNIPGINGHDLESITPEFDFDRINYLERLLLSHESKWQKYFEENHLNPLVLVYEEFADDHAEAVREVLMYLGLSYPKQIDLRSRLRRQSDAVTEKWVQIYSELKQNHLGSTGRLTGVVSLS